MSRPTSKEQLRFLSNLQRLLSEGQFVATYKFALLLALADLCIEEGEDTGAPFVITTRKIAEKFVAYYWRQARPYIGTGGVATGGVLLRQNTGATAAVIRLLHEKQRRGYSSLAKVKKNPAGQRELLGKVDAVVRTMPLWKLQTVGEIQLDFLYENLGRGSIIPLRPGVMFCFRKFHSLVTDLVRGAWLRYVRRFNGDLLGNPTDLDQFLFGSERAPLAVYAPVLHEVQEAQCLYCGKSLRRQEQLHVDHFIPWARYPVDLGHNFVLVHQRCNAAKGEHLAAAEHLSRWTQRNRVAEGFLRGAFDARGILYDLNISSRIALWAYSNASEVSALTWLRGREFERLDPAWSRCFS